MILPLCRLQRKRSAHERHWDTVISGEWADGVRWADDKPRENLDVDAISLIHSGACGAFVHGLEDEFMGMRREHEKIQPCLLSVKFFRGPQRIT